MTSSSISDIQLAIELSREIESALVARGATGTGLREKAMCFEAHLPSHVWTALRTIGRERNHVGHVHGAVLSDREGYVRACELVLQAIRTIPAHAVASLPPPRPGFRSPYPAGARDRRPAQSSAWQFAYGMVENHVRRKVRRTATRIAGFFILATVGILLILIASALTWTTSRKHPAADTQTTLPSLDTSIDPHATALSSTMPDTRDRIGARGPDTGRNQRKPAGEVAGSAVRSPARADHSRPLLAGDDPVGALPSTANDALPRLEAHDAFGTGPGVGADLALGKLAAPPASPRDTSRASPTTKPGHVDLRSQDLDSF